MQLRYFCKHKILNATLFLVTILISPWFSFDSVNIPKFTALATGSSLLLGYLLFDLKYILKSNIKFVLLLIGIFIFWSGLSYIYSPMNNLEGLYGVDGRLTGLITYVCLGVIFCSAASISNVKQLKGYFKILLATGIINSAYAIMQILKLDPILWNTLYKPIFGFFGNSNFLAAFLGISASACLAPTLIGKYNKITNISLIVYIIIALFIIIYSESEQGIFVFMSGLFMTFFIILKNSERFKKYLITYSILIGFGALVIISDLFQIAPWKSFLYSPSIAERGEFWSAAIRMTFDHPLLGVGLDGFQDNFHRFRDLSAANRDPSAKVNSVHNVLLDFSVGGGFPLAIIYIVLCALVVRSAIRYVSRSTTNDPYFIAIFSAWVGYQVQSLISINQLGLAIWGWALGGTIIGYERMPQADPITNKSKNKTLKFSATAISFLLAMFISIPQFIADTNFRSALRSGNVNLLMKSAYEWPQSITRLNLIATILLENNFTNQAYQVSKYSIEKYSNNLQAWKIYYRNTNISLNEKNEAFARITELDPLNSN